MRSKGWLVLVILAACGHHEMSRGQDPAHSAGARRDIGKLDRIAYTPQSCSEHADCPTGSHCDEDTGACAWSCLADSECGAGRSCDLYGSCVLAIGPYSANDSAGCQAVPADERRTALLALYNNAQQGDFITCDSDDACPCGSRCSVDAVCTVECISDSPPPELACASGLTCSPFGTCVNGPPPPPTPVVLTLAFSDITTSANTASAAVVKPVSVTVSATSLDALSLGSPAIVKFSIAEVRDFQQGRTDVAPVPAPRVKCAAGDALADSCQINGGWVFDVNSGQLRSLPKTIWVEIPQTTTPQSWTLEARSDWAVAPTADVIRAEPVIIPATDPGHYKGTLTLANRGAAAGDRSLSVPVDAIVTATHVAVFEPTRVMFPDGHAVLARDPAKATLLGWLSTTNARYDVALGAPALTYDATTGHLAGTFAVTDGSSAASTSATLSLDRTGDVDAPACPCATNNYCNADMNRCLPGSGPPSGGGIVAAASAVPSATLPSATLAAWSPPLQQIATSFPALLGTIETAYCYKAANASPPAFGSDPTNLDTVSGDLKCNVGAVTYSEPTFAFENRDTEYVGTTGGATFDLFESCKADLAAQPTGAITPQNLLGDNLCASVGRFLLALRANSGVASPDLTQRLVHHVLRQWLGANAYVASTAIKDREFDDALSITAAPAQDQLGSAIDLVDSGLRVLLDPTIRPQYATGTGLPSVLAAPDYRIKPRPISRWTFNERVSPTPDVEGSAPFTATGVSLVDSDLKGIYPRSVAPTCGTAQPVALEDRRYTIAFDLHYTPQTGTTTVLFDKLAPNGDRLWLEATTSDMGAHLALTLKDSHGGVAVFPPVVQGFIAITVDGSVYRDFVVPPGLPPIANIASSVVGGGPRWGAAGPVKLACDIPIVPGSCTSWDRNLPGDGLDVVYQAPYVDQGASETYTCTTRLSDWTETCSGIEPTDAHCATEASAYRAQVIAGLFPNPPPGATTPLTVAGHVVIDSDTTRTTKISLIETQTYHCNFTVANRPVPVTGVKPVCTPETIRWDEVSLWSRPVTTAELAAMAASYNETRANQSLPPRPPPPAFSNQQTIGLPVHLIEAASADLDLLATYIAAEQAAMYQECYLGGPSAARDRVAARAGRNLRLVALLESEAEHLVSLAPAASWRSRYDAAHAELAGRRTKAFEALELANQCKNPLGIGEDDLPLFVGEEVGASAKFFASSRFLTAKAKEEIGLAQTKLTTAQTRYTEQRQSVYQLNQARESKTLRLTKLRSDAESTLIRYCGQPAGTQKLLDGFLAGTMTPSNCYLKTELPECTNLAGVTLANTPASCLRGELGSRILAIKTADIDMANAENALARATEQFDGDSVYCARRQAELDGDQQLLEKHNAHMGSLRRQAQVLQGWFNVLNTFTAFASGDVMKGFGGLANLEQSLLGDSLQDQEADENARYAEVVSARSHAADIESCFHSVDNEKFSIDASRDVIKRSRQQVIDAAFELDSSQNAITGVVAETAGELSVENTLDSTPPHLHYWLDTDISDYHRHLEYARRLTYLALRAFEYESQQSIGNRTETLIARRPEDLLAVVTAIEARNAPMQGELGLVVGSRPLVLSVRDEIVRFPDMTVNRLPGEKVRTPEQAFHDYMASDSSIIVDATGKFLGRGIRFSLRPDAWTETSCAERIWRLLPSLQIDNPPTQHGMVLYQDNAFGSQDCRADFGAVTLSHADPSQNLLTGDTAIFGTPASSTPVNIDGPLGLDHEQLRSQPESSISGLAGRGLYSNYVLLFPKQTWPDSEIAKIKDVLLRFDIVEVTHSPAL